MVMQVIILNLKFEPYFEVLYPLQVDDIPKTLKVYHCLFLVTIDLVDDK